jgi:hypothetical protein
MRRKSIAAFRVSRNVAGNGESFPAIGFFAVTPLHVAADQVADVLAGCFVESRFAHLKADFQCFTGLTVENWINNH